MRPNKPILLVEDDAVDVITVRRALREIEVKNQLDIANDGLDALEYLNVTTSQKPGIILLDLNMPRMNGIEFLKVVKQDERLKMIPVVVLTTSGADQDKIESYRLGVAGYMIKPVDYPKFVDVMRTIDKYWTVNELPE